MEAIITDIEVLSAPAEPLTFLTEQGAQTEEGTEIVNKIKEVMEANKELLALAAPQIGINKRIFCLRFNDQIKTFINPIITKKKGLNIVIETCASMPGKEIVIGRPEEVTVVYYNDEFKYEDNKLVGVAASLFDQQAQILDGVLPSELGLVSDIEEDGRVYYIDSNKQKVYSFEGYVNETDEHGNVVVNLYAVRSKQLFRVNVETNISGLSVNVADMVDSTIYGIMAYESYLDSLAGVKISLKNIPQFENYKYYSLYFTSTSATSPNCCGSCICMISA